MWQEADTAGDDGLGRGASKQARTIEVGVVDEEAAHRVWEVMREQQPASVDNSEPCLAHAAGGGEVAWLKAAEDFGKRIVWQGLRMIHS
jgi:hypothetical protein